MEFTYSHRSFLTLHRCGLSGEPLKGIVGFGHRLGNGLSVSWGDPPPVQCPPSLLAVTAMRCTPVLPICLYVRGSC